MEDKIRQLIRQCEADCQTAENDPFYSNVYHAQLEELRRLLERLRESGAASLLSLLKSELPELEENLRQEEDHPTFDWYDEYHHAKRLTGVLDARRAVIKLLESAEQ